MSLLCALLLHPAVTLLVTVMSVSSSKQDSVEFLGVRQSSEPSLLHSQLASSMVNIERRETHQSFPLSDYAEQYLHMPKLLLSAVAVAQAAEGALLEFRARLGTPNLETVP